MSTDDRDWFAPKNPHAGGSPAGPPPGGPGGGRTASRPRRQPYPDQQVWPPPQREGVTQPMPAIRESATPLPRRGLPPHQPPPPPGAAHRSPAPHQQALRPPDPPQPLPPQAAPQPPQPEVSHEAAAPPEAAPPQVAPRRRGRAALIGVAAVVSLLTGVGIHAYDGYVFYEKVAAENTRVVPVPAGQAGKVHDIEWKATVSRTEGPPDSKHGSDVAWMKIAITEKVLSEGSATMTAEPADVKLHDRAGRTWAVELADGDRPTDRLEVGKEYALEGLAVVPVTVAGEVELALTPGDYRSDTPTAELLKPKTGAAAVATTLRFRR